MDLASGEVVLDSGEVVLKEGELDLKLGPLIGIAALALLLS